MFKATILHCKATGLGTIRATKIKFVVNHAPGAGLIVRPIDLQSSMLLQCYDCPLNFTPGAGLIAEPVDLQPSML